MKKCNPRDMRIASLRKGKVKGVGFFESIPLKIAGRIDSKRSLPNEINGKWVSPHIEKEIRSYDEFSSRMYGELQLEEEQAFARLAEVMDSVAHIKHQLDDAEAKLQETQSRESSVDNSRKFGEESLTESQVIARRTREREKRLSPVKARVSTLTTKLTSEIDEFSAIRAKIIENNNTTRMICNRVKDHSYQRLAVYWNSALYKHPEKNKMPTIPKVEILCNAEAIYLEPHRTLLEKAKSLSEILSTEPKEVA